MPLSAVIKAGSMRATLEVRDGVVVTACDNVSSSVGKVTNSSFHAWPHPYASSMTGPPTVVVVDVELVGDEIGRLRFMRDVSLVISVGVAATGKCLPPNFRTRADVRWTLTPLPPDTPTEITRKEMFRAAAWTGSVVGSNGLAALSTTGLVSLLSLDDCLFSDVDPLDPSVSPTGLAIGDELGQHYRGAIVAGLGVYLALTLLALTIAGALLVKFRVKDDSIRKRLAMLHCPSLGMVVVGVFHQGLASCGVSIIRLGLSATDVALGAFSLFMCGTISICVIWVTTGSRMPCFTESVQSEHHAARPRWVRQFLRFTTWQRHWVEDIRRQNVKSAPYKKQYMMLIDDLQLPWWSGVELVSSCVQGATLGIRANDINTCRGQLWAISAQCVVVGVLNLLCRPCGALSSNVFLSISKVLSAAIAVFVLLHALLLQDIFSTLASDTALAAVFLSTLQTAVQVLVAVLLFLPKLMKLNAKQFSELVRDWLALRAIAATTTTAREHTWLSSDGNLDAVLAEDQLLCLPSRPAATQGNLSQGDRRDDRRDAEALRVVLQRLVSAARGGARGASRESILADVVVAICHANGRARPAHVVSGLSPGKRKPVL